MSENCDCKLFCGDDPWLKSGRSEYCEEYNKAKKALDLKLKEHPMGEVAEVDLLNTHYGETTRYQYVKIYIDNQTHNFDIGDKYQLIKIED